MLHFIKQSRAIKCITKPLYNKLIDNTFTHKFTRPFINKLLIHFRIKHDVPNFIYTYFFRCILIWGKLPIMDAWCNWLDPHVPHHAYMESLIYFNKIQVGPITGELGKWIATAYNYLFIYYCPLINWVMYWDYKTGYINFFLFQH